MKKGQIAEGNVTTVEFPNKGIVMTDEDDWKKKRNDLPSDDSNSDEEDQKDIDVDKI